MPLARPPPTELFIVARLDSRAFRGKGEIATEETSKKELVSTFQVKDLGGAGEQSRRCVNSPLGTCWY